MRFQGLVLVGIMVGFVGVVAVANLVRSRDNSAPMGAFFIASVIWTLMAFIYMAAS